MSVNLKVLTAVSVLWSSSHHGLHQTTASSEWSQLCSPMAWFPPRGQSNRLASYPSHRKLSSQIGPVPWPKFIAPRLSSQRGISHLNTRNRHTSLTPAEHHALSGHVHWKRNWRAELYIAAISCYKATCTLSHRGNPPFRIYIQLFRQRV